ncbi:MAG: 6-carboxytetrahydropterin synthase QueD [Candidatus Omnitrophica bacterium]|nr:6-carboxytetrahydropterin synthase QueD [Candidatus Omnitrophota bacterium]
MFELTVISDFSAAHKLRGYAGKCENLHGHNWKVSVVVESKDLNRLGIVMDFKDIKKELNKVLEKLDHKDLNKLVFFKKINPSSENIASFIYSRISSKLKDKGVNVQKVSVWETDTSCATYFK